MRTPCLRKLISGFALFVPLEAHWPQALALRSWARPRRYFRNSASEVILQRRLHRSRTGGAGNLAKVRVAQRRVRTAQLRRVPPVESLPPELDTLPLPHPERLRHGHIPRPGSRPIQRVARRGAISDQRPSECSRVEPAAQRALIAGQSGALAENQVRANLVVRGLRYRPGRVDI